MKSNQNQIKTFRKGVRKASVYLKYQIQSSYE